MIRPAEESDQSRNLYARGYILRDDAEPAAPGHWMRARFGEWHLAHDPRLPAAQTRLRLFGCELLALGVLVDARHPEEDPEACLSRLARALARSEEALHAALDHTGGRYVLAYRRRGRAGIVSDATGMKPVFYHARGPRIVTSHPGLIMENAPVGPRRPLPAKFGYPGVRGPVQHSMMLTPNAALDLAGMTPARVWPRGVLAERSVGEAAEIVRTHMGGLMRHVRRHHRLLVSVTAGLDSRLTLSFLKDAEDVRFFTYYRDERLDTDPEDLAFAELLRDGLGRDVEVLRLGGFPAMPQGFREMLETNTFITHQKHLAWVYAHRYGAKKNLVHLRSNISEIGREFWRGKNVEVGSGKDLARLYLQRDREYPAAYVFRVITLFEEFDRVTGLSACRGRVDLKSLFYWEFRMASWHAQLVAESDPAFETLSLFNCRAALEAMLSVPRADRAGGSVLRRVISENWPELAEYPVNGKPFWPV